MAATQDQKPPKSAEPLETTQTDRKAERGATLTSKALAVRRRRGDDRADAAPGSASALNPAMPASTVAIILCRQACTARCHPSSLRSVRQRRRTLSPRSRFVSDNPPRRLQESFHDGLMVTVAQEVSLSNP
jgi:hypothetical protein